MVFYPKEHGENGIEYSEKNFYKGVMVMMRPTWG